MPDLAAWYGPLLGQRIDVDGAFPGECHDVGLAWMYALGVQPGDGHAPGTGYTDQVWRQFPFHRPRLADRFLKTHGTGEIGPGSLVYWARYGGMGGLPHVAVALETPRDGKVLCVTQNPGPVRIERLALDGVLGTLNPIASTPTPTGRTAAPKPKEDDMPESMFAVVNGVPSWCWLNWSTGRIYAVHTQAEADWIGGYMGSVTHDWSRDPIGSDKYKNKLAMFGLLAPKPEIVSVQLTDAERQRLVDMITAGVTAR